MLRNTLGKTLGLKLEREREVLLDLAKSKRRTYTTGLEMIPARFKKNITLLFLMEIWQPGAAFRVELKTNGLGNTRGGQKVLL